jgi:pimeloyl-ACP methyl ester carboxylesterase
LGPTRSVFRRLFTTTFIPDATEEQMAWMDELQRTSTSTENAINSRIARYTIDVTDRLPEITAPTLVLHADDDRAAAGWGQRLAAQIPDARLVPPALPWRWVPPSRVDRPSCS